MRISAVIFFSFFICISFAQTAPTKYWIQFTDKNTTPHSLFSPETYLSQRAINRRLNHNIAIDSTDLPVSPSYIASIAGMDSVMLLNKSRWFNAITIKTTDTNTLNIIKALPFVKKTEPVGIIKWKDKIEAHFTEYDFTNETAYSKIIEPLPAYNYGAASTQINMIGINCMHSQGYNGEGVVISVLDAGFFSLNTIPAFDSIINNNQVLGTWDFVTGNDSVYEDHTHGMYVMSIMAANQPGSIIGTAPKASYWLLRTEEAASEFLIEEDNWVAAAEFADSVGSDIINSSLGYTTFDDPSQNHTYANMDGNTTRITIGADLAAKKGIVVVNSAGNSGSSSWKYIGAPADGDSVLTVGAVTSNRFYAAFSSIGPTYDGRIKPNISAMGQGTVFALTNGNIAQGNGTSFSSPLIAGAVACLWQANPTANNMQLINAIEQSGDQSSSPDNLLGYGIPNFCIAHQLLGGEQADKFISDNIIKVFPVPFSNELNLSFYSSVEQNITIELYDIRGRKIAGEQKTTLHNSYNTYTINNLSTLAGGIYLLTIHTETEGKHTYKTIKH